MATFALMCFDKPNSLALRLASRDAHFAYGRSAPGVVRLGGPFLNDAGEMIGSLIIIEAADLAAARAWHEADPYKLAGLFERVELLPWKATFGELP
jgi:uncharacterized protein YciI